MEEQSAHEYNECGANADSATKRLFEDPVAEEERRKTVSAPGIPA